MKRARNICIRALCAIFVGIVLGCSGSGDSGGESDIENDGGNGDNGQEAGWQQPAYMDITNELEGQRFVESNADWFYDNQNDKDTKFITRYDDANQYIKNKVAELQKLWQEKNTGSTLSNQIGTALSNFNNGSSISQKIDNNYNALLPVFRTMEQYIQSTTKEYYSYKASYHKLAATAYMQSLGQAVNNTADFPSIVEIRTGSTFAAELKQIDPSYTSTTFTPEQAKILMGQSLNTIASSTSTNNELLKEIVGLAMVNESLYGLNDYAEKVGVNVNVVGLKSQKRDLKYFEEMINPVRSINIDDRTM